MVVLPIVLALRGVRAVRSELRRTGVEGSQHLGRIGQAGDRVTGSLGAAAGAVAQVGVGFVVAQAAIGVATAALVTFAAAAAVVVPAALKTAAALDEITRAADAARVTTDLFQTLRLEAESAGIGQGRLNTAMRDFGQRVEEARAGAGPLNDALEGVNEGLLSGIRNARDNDAALRLVAEAMGETSSRAERAAISQAAFGAAWADMERVLRGGAEGLDEARERAGELGAVLEEHTVRRAQELRQEIGRAGEAIGTNFQAILAEVLPEINSFAQALARASRELRLLIVGPDTASLTAEIAEIESEIGRVEAAIEKAKAAGEDPGAVTGFVDQARLLVGLGAQSLDDQLAALEERLARAEDRREAIEQANRRAREEGGAGDDPEADADFRRAERLAEIGNSFETNIEITEEWRKQLEMIGESGQAVAANLDRAFSEFVRTGKLDFADLARSIIADLLQIQFRAAVLEPLFGTGRVSDSGELDGGLFGDVLASVLHGGGTAGIDGGRRAVPAIAFAGAQRLHDGGRVFGPDEVPAVLQRGERVTPRGEGGGDRVRVEIINQSGGEVREERRREGGEDITRIVIGPVREAMARGDFDDVMDGRFGQRPRTRRT